MGILRDRLYLPGDAASAITKKGMERVDLKALGIFPGLVGGARGFNQEGDILTQTVDGRPLNDVWAEFQASLQLHNQFRQRVVDLLTYPVGNPIEDIPQMTGDDFEEASEFGEPKGIRVGDYFSLGFDFKWYDLAVRYTWRFLSESTAAQVEALNNLAIEADSRLVFNKVLKAVFNNATRVADIRGTNYNVYPFYNGDSTVPPSFKNYTHTTGHQHYLASGGATVVSADLIDIIDHLKHHGYSQQQGAKLVLLANSVETATIAGFRVASGDRYDFIPAVGQPPFLLPTNTGGIQGGQPSAEFQGLTVVGQWGPLLIVEEDYIPSGYMFAFATGGPESLNNPIGIREHQNTGLRGLRLVKGRDNDYPLVDSFYQRGFGTGVRHRGAGVVMKVTAGAYTVPAAYA